MMKLASLRSGGRDGGLIVLGRELRYFQAVPEIAPSLTLALEHWVACQPRLADVYSCLENGHARHAQPFNPLFALPPLPGGGAFAVRGGEEIIQVNASGPRVELEAGSQPARVLRPGLALMTAPNSLAEGLAQSQERIRFATLVAIVDPAQSPWKPLGRREAIFAPAAVTADELWGEGLPACVCLETKGASTVVFRLALPELPVVLAAIASCSEWVFLPLPSPETGAERPDLALHLAPGDVLRLEVKAGDVSLFGVLEASVLPAGQM